MRLKLPFCMHSPGNIILYTGVIATYNNYTMECNSLFMPHEERPNIIYTFLKYNSLYNLYFPTTLAPSISSNKIFTNADAIYAKSLHKRESYAFQRS